MIPVLPPCHSICQPCDIWMQTGLLNVFRQHDDNGEWLAGWVRNWNWEGLHGIKFFFFLHIFGIFSRIYLGLGVQRCVIITLSSISWSFASTGFLSGVKPLSLFLDPVSTAMDGDGTATLAGYQRNGGPSQDVTHFELLAATTHHFHLHQHQTIWGSRRDVCCSGKFFFSLFIVITLTIIVYGHYTVTTTLHHQHQHHTDKKWLEMQHISGLR